jgi:MFS family permease
VAFLAGAFILNYVDRQVVFSIFPLLRRDLGFSDAQLGAAGTLFTWTYSLVMPVSGRLADIFPRAKLVILSLLLWSIATLATGLSTSVGLFLASRIAMGLCESLYVPAAIGLIAQAHSGPTRSRALSIHGFAQYTGITLGGWYGGWAADHIGWRRGFATLAALGILYAGALAWGFRNHTAARVTAEKHGTSGMNLFHSSPYLSLCALFLSFCAMLWTLYAWLPVFIYERYGLSLMQTGLTATIYLQVSSATGVLLGGVAGDLLSRRYSAGRLQIVIWGLLSCAPFALATFAVHSLALLKLSACGFGLFAGFLMANIFSALYDVVGAKAYGLATGVMNAIGGLGAGSAILAAGIWKQALGIERLMVGWLILSMSCAIFLFLLIRSMRQKVNFAAN